VTLTDHQSRLLPLLGADNARDLGGLPTADGRSTRRGRLFRGALISELVPGDIELLVQRVGLRTVVDLRTDVEVDAVAARWDEHEIAWVHCPLYLGHRQPIHDPRTDHAAAYVDYLTGDPEPALRAVTTLMDPAAHPALFHCAAGKDRTGVVAASLLEVLSVPDETIAEDYAMTLDVLPAILERLKTLEPYTALRATALEDHIPHAETMRRFLRRLEDQVGGAAGWLASNGVSSETLERFRGAMLSDSPD
jgi:protein-tyrosine phosphatase